MAPEARESIENGRKQLMAEIRRDAQAALSAGRDGEAAEDGGRGIELVDVGLSRVDFVPEVRDAAFERLIALMEAIATKNRSEGEQRRQEIINEAQAEAESIRGEGSEQSNILRGEAEAKIIEAYAAAIEESDGFYDFNRTLELYEKALGGSGTRLILSTDNPLLRLLTEGDALEGPPSPRSSSGDSVAGSPRRHDPRRRGRLPERPLTRPIRGTSSGPPVGDRTAWLIDRTVRVASPKARRPGDPIVTARFAPSDHNGRGRPDRPGPPAVVDAGEASRCRRDHRARTTAEPRRRPLRTATERSQLRRRPSPRNRSLALVYAARTSAHRGAPGRSRPASGRSGCHWWLAHQCSGSAAPASMGQPPGPPDRRWPRRSAATRTATERSQLRRRPSQKIPFLSMTYADRCSAHRGAPNRARPAPPVWRRWRARPCSGREPPTLVGKPPVAPDPARTTSEPRRRAVRTATERSQIRRGSMTRNRFLSSIYAARPSAHRERTGPLSTRVGPTPESVWPGIGDGVSITPGRSPGTVDRAIRSHSQPR